MLPKPAPDGGETLFLDRGLVFGQVEEIGTGQVRQTGMQSLRSFRDYKERGVVSIAGALCELDREPGLADSTQAVDRLRLGDRRGLPLLEFAKLLIAAFEEVSERGEGEVVKTGRDQSEGSGLSGGLLSGDPPL